MPERIVSIDDLDVRYMHDVEGMSIRKIADFYGVSRSVIWRRLSPDKVRRYPQSEKGKAARKRYFQTDKGKDAVKKYLKTDKGKLALEIYRESDKGKETAKEYWHTKSGIISRAKDIKQRRGLEYIHYNKPSVDTESHHIDKRHIINIPKEIHRSIPHNVCTGRNMEAINKEAMNFLMYEMQEGIVLRW